MEVPTDKVSIEESHHHKSTHKDIARKDRAKL
jgi:hypothetical protein